LNIQRGRDHGLPSYNDTRQALGLQRQESFADVTQDLEIQSRLAQAYADVDDIDVWVGGLAEEKLEGAMVGELMFVVMKQQFEALRDGDRFWYTRTLSRARADEIERTSLADVIRRNTNIGNELAADVFHIQ